MAGPTKGLDVTGAGNALELEFDRTRNLLQLERGPFRVIGPEGEADDGHIVDALGLDQRLANADMRAQPVGMRHHGIVELDQRVLVWDADLELHRNDRHARPRHRIHMLDTGDARKHLLAGARHQRLDVARRRARKRHQHVGHRHVDLWLFFLGSDQGGEHPEQQEHQRNQRGQRVTLKGGGYAPGNAHGLRHRPALSARCARRCRHAPGRARWSRHPSGQREFPRYRRAATRPDAPGAARNRHARRPHRRQ